MNEIVINLLLFPGRIAYIFSGLHYTHKVSIWWGSLMFYKPIVCICMLPTLFLHSLNSSFQVCQWVQPFETISRILIYFVVSSYLDEFEMFQIAKIPEYVFIFICALHNVEKEKLEKKDTGGWFWFTNIGTAAIIHTRYNIGSSILTFYFIVSFYLIYIRQWTDHQNDRNPITA